MLLSESYILGLKTFTINIKPDEASSIESEKDKHIITFQTKLATPNLNYQSWSPLNIYPKRYCLNGKMFQA